MTPGEYTVAQVAELVGLTPRRVRRFVALGLLRPHTVAGEDRFAFGDVALLRAWAKLPGASPARIRRALHAGRARTKTDLSLRSEGSSIVAQDDAGSFEPASGQQLLDFDDPSGAAVTAIPRLDADAGEAAQRAEADDPAAAAGLYLRAIEADPADAQAMINLGRLRHCGGDPAEAAAWYERAATAAESDLAPTAWFNLGVAREDLGDRPGALQAYRNALRVDSGCADAHYNAARLCELAGDQLGALRHLRAYREHCGQT